MVGFILGSKNSHSQTFTTEGERIPTVFINTSPCYCIDIKNLDKHGYFAVKLGFGKTNTIKKTIQGERIKAGIKSPLRFFKEIRLDEKTSGVQIISEEKKTGLQIGDTKIFIGDEIKPTMLFKKDDLIHVTGVSKGKGFQGVVGRHHFKGGPKTHGQSDRERAPGSIGQTTTPGRVYKGKRMAGRTGGEQKTIRNMQITEVLENGIKVIGAVPGYTGGLLIIRTAK